VLESRRGTDHEPADAGWYRSLSSPDSHLASLSAARRADTATNRTQSVVVRDCVDSIGELHRTVDTRLRSVARRGQEVRRHNVRAENISGRHCSVLCVADSFPRPHLPERTRAGVGSPRYAGTLPQA
jgi:hypothetical protein